MRLDSNRYWLQVEVHCSAVKNLFIVIYYYSSEYKQVYNDFFFLINVRYPITFEEEKKNNNQVHNVVYIKAGFFLSAPGTMIHQP